MPRELLRTRCQVDGSENSSRTDRPKVSRPCAPIRPSERHSYFDKAQLWFREPLSLRRRNWLEGRCALYPLEPPTGYWPYSQGFQIKQRVAADVLPWLATLDASRVLFNALEVALDLTFNNAIDLHHATEFFDQHFIQRWNKQGPRFVEGTRYAGRRGSANLPTSYADGPCRITGEVYCLHIEWRVNGSPALKRLGIGLAGLPTFDHRAFWSKRLLLGSIDRTLLGRLACNRFRGTPRRREWTACYGNTVYDFHRRAASILINRLDSDRPSTQNLIDEYGAKLNLMRSLVRFDVEHLLPP